MEDYRGILVIINNITSKIYSCVFDMEENKSRQRVNVNLYIYWLLQVFKQLRVRLVGRVCLSQRQIPTDGQLQFLRHRRHPDASYHQPGSTGSHYYSHSSAVSPTHREAGVRAGEKKTKTHVGACWLQMLLQRPINIICLCILTNLALVVTGNIAIQAIFKCNKKRNFLELDLLQP